MDFADGEEEEEEADEEQSLPKDSTTETSANALDLDSYFEYVMDEEVEIPEDLSRQLLTQFVESESFWTNGNPFTLT